MRTRFALALGIVALRLPTLTEPQWYSDDGFFTAVAWSMAHGRPLYQGVFDNSPPGIYWLFRGLVALGAADHNWVIQAAATAAVGAAALLTLEVAGRLLGPRPALLAGALTGLLLSIPTLDGDLINVELAALPFFLAALALAFREEPPALLAAGALLGFAVTTRPSYALDGAALLVPLISLSRPRRPVRLLLAAAGGLAGIAAVALAMAATGSLAAYVNLVMPSDHAYLMWSNGGTPLPLAARLALLGLGGAAGAWRARSTAARLAAVWTAAAVAGATLTPREFTHYLQEAVPAIAFGVALLTSRLRPRPLAVAAAGAGALAAVHLVLFLPAWETHPGGGADAGWRPSIAYARLPGYYGNWAALVAGRQSWTAYADWFPGYSREQVAAREVRARAAGSDVIVVGDEPWLYVHADLLPATRYLATNSAFWQVGSGPGDLRAAIVAGSAPVVVVAPDGRGWVPDILAGPYRQVPGSAWPVFVRAPER